MSLKTHALQIWEKSLGRTALGRRLLFQYIWKNNHWDNAESISGPGSSLAETTGVREALPGLFGDLGIRSLLDAPCGDLNWLRQTDIDLDEYVGMDIVPDLVSRPTDLPFARRISLIQGDMISSELPRCDAILSRDSFIHLSLSAGEKCIENFSRSGARYLLSNTYPHVENTDIPTGRWRPVNLALAPYGLGQPLKMIDERSTLTPGKFLGVWEIASSDK